MKSVWITEMGLKSNDSLCKRQNLCLPSKKLLDPQHYHPLKRDEKEEELLCLVILRAKKSPFWVVELNPL